jgi:hypothetical protein
VVRRYRSSAKREKIPRLSSNTYNIARVYALAGKSEEALKWMRTTIAEGLPNYPLFERDRFLDPIREDPAFKQLLSEMKSRWEGYQCEFG